PLYKDALRAIYPSKTPYNETMARGWESKSVEDQISEKQEAKTLTGKKLTVEEKHKSEHRSGLLLARANTLTSLDSATDPRYRALLERRLAHLDAELAE